MIKDSDRIAIIAGEHRVTYSELLQRITTFSHHTPQERGAKTLLFSENREGWIYAFFSIWNNRGIAVPVDATSTVDDVAYIVRDCQPQCIWVSQGTQEVARKALAQTGIDIPVLVIDEVESLAPDAIKAKIDHEPQDTALIIYTSGTTGSPKGVMLSFANLYANMHGVIEEVPVFTPDRRTMILLPLHHVLPLMGTVVCPILGGGGVAICPALSGPAIMETLAQAEVAIMVGVPRLWQTLYTGIKKKIDEHAITRFLFWLCERVGSRRLSRTIFASVHKKMGGHLYCMVSGGAALDREIGCGLRTLGIDVLEGYGMTETAPIIAFTRPGDIIPGCVGLPLPSVECKIVNGELLAKGPNVMQGYYNRPEETAAVLDADGFVHTGDLAEFDEKGRVYITGRSKEIIVLSNGKNIQPNEIEYKIEKYDAYVRECAVTQQGDLLCAIIVPQNEWAEGKTDEEMEAMLKEQVIIPYNETVVNYKKLMRIMVYRGDLPRTKMEKLQRYKLKDILSGKTQPQQQEEIPEPELEEYRTISQFVSALKKVPVRPTDHVEADLAMDSLDKVELQGFLENSFGVTIRVDEMAGFANVLAMAEHVAAAKTRSSIEETDWGTLMHQEGKTLELPISALTHPMGAKLFKCFHTLYNRLEIRGQENIPSTDGFILAPNHQSFIDGPLAMSGVAWGTIRRTYFYATEEHVRGTFRRWMARRHNIILMERKDLKNSILKLALVLRQGKNICIFPEGRRTDDGQLGQFKKTFAILSVEMQAPIVPVRITGAYEVLSRTQHVMRPSKLIVEYLPPITPQPGETYEQLSDRVKAAIAAH